MSRSKHAKPDEVYLGEIRQLKKLVKSLRQRIRQLEKAEQTFEDQVEDESIVDLPIGEKQSKLPCHSCGKGFYQEFAIMDKIIGTCGVCRERKRLK